MFLEVHPLFSQVLQFLINISKTSEETKTSESGTNANGVRMLEIKKAITRKARVPETKKVDLEKYETNDEPYTEPSVRTSVTEKSMLQR